MAEPVEMLLGVARERPDPRAVASWLVAYLGTRPLKAKRAALDHLEAQVTALNLDARQRGLVLGVIAKTRGGLK